MASKNPEQRQIQQAITAFAQGNFTQAAQLFEHIVKTRPQDQELKLWLASSHQQAGHLEEARQIYQFVLNSSTRDDLIQAARNGLSQIQHLSSPPEPAAPPSDQAEPVADETAPPAHLLNRPPDLDRLATDLSKELDQLEERQDEETSDLDLADLSDLNDLDEIAELEELDEGQAELMADPLKAEERRDLDLADLSDLQDLDEMAELQELDEGQSETLADPVEAEIFNVESELDDVVSLLEPLEEMPSEPLADAVKAEILNADAGLDEENLIPSLDFADQDPESLAEDSVPENPFAPDPFADLSAQGLEETIVSEPETPRESSSTADPLSSLTPEVAAAETIPADLLDTDASLSIDLPNITEAVLDDSGEELEILENLEDLDVNLDDLNEEAVDVIDQIPDAPNVESISPQLEADLLTSEAEGSEAIPGSQVPEASHDHELQATELTQTPESFVPESQAPESQALESQAPDQTEASDETNLLSSDLPPPPELPSDPTAVSLEQAWEELLDYVDQHENSSSS